MSNSNKIRIFDEGTGSEIHAGSLKFLLPNGSSFVVGLEPGRAGSAVFVIPQQDKEVANPECFSIEPGAANVFAVNVIS